MLTVFLAIGAVGLALLVISLVVGEIHGGLFEWIDNDLFSGAAVSAFLSALGFVGALVESTSGNTTVTEATSNAFITAWPTGESQPWASMQNTVRGTTRANQAMVKVGTGGQINVSNSNGSVHVITDVVGYFT